MTGCPLLPPPPHASTDASVSVGAAPGPGRAELGVVLGGGCRFHNEAPPPGRGDRGCPEKKIIGGEPNPWIQGFYRTESEGCEGVGVQWHRQW